MADDMVRTEIELPRDLIEKIDRLAGPEGRANFITGAVEERVRRNGLLAVLDDPSFGINLADYPQWSSSEKVSEWVRRMRRGGSDQAERDPSWLRALYDEFAPVRDEAETAGYSEDEINVAIDDAIAASRASRANRRL